jgi:hypothetical protein
MSKIIISQNDKDALAAARRAGESRTYLWQRIHDTYRVPRSMSLAVTCQRELYLKGTDPKQFLIADTYGRYSHTMIDTAPVTATVQVPVNASRFTVASQPLAVARTGWSSITVENLLDMLRNGSDLDDLFQDNPALPEGFPQDVDHDAVVFDTFGAALYFRM